MITLINCKKPLIKNLHEQVTPVDEAPFSPRGYLGPGGLHEWGMYRGCTGGAAGYIDRALLGAEHVYRHPTCASVYGSNTPYDPEGLLGVLTSVLVVSAVMVMKVMMTAR